MKKLKWVVLGLVGLVVVVVVVLFVNLNSIVRTTVEKQATTSLRVPTTLGGANVSVFGGDVSLSGLNVGSPEGYKAPQMLSLGALDVDTSWSGIRSDPVRVQNISIDAPRLVLEMKGTAFNIKQFIDGLPKSDEPEPTPDGESKPLKLIIDRLTVTNAQVAFRPDAGALANLPGLADKLKPEYLLTIPPISMEQIGTADGNQNGVAIKEVVTRLVTTMAGKAAESPELPPELRALLTGDLSSIADTLKAKGMVEVQKQVDAVKGQLQEKIGGELGGKVGEALNNPDLKNDPGKAVGGLLQGLGKPGPTTRE